MDSLLDLIGGLFGQGDAAERRSMRKQARLHAAAQADPVTAQRPVAPIRAAGASNDDSTLQMTSMSDEGGIDSTVNATGVSLEGSIQSETEKVYAWDQPEPSNPSDSIEAMAMLSVPVTTTTPIVQQPVVQGLRCKGCQSSVSAGERFCPNCGLDV